MDNEKIKELAERYAEFTDLSPVDQLRVKLISKEFLTWVCKTHCIVEKGEIKSLNKEVTNTYLAGSHISYDGWMYILKRFFGEDYQNILKQ